MNFSGADRTRQLVTVGIGTLLMLVMGGVLIAGFRLATQMNAKVTALQTASVLQTYPNTITSQLKSLRDRLEARAYAGQALADVRATVEKFDQEMKQLGTIKAGDSSTLDQATSLWAQYGPVTDPVIDFHGQPYVDSDESGSSFSAEGRAHYADVKRASLFAQENAKRLQTQIGAVATRMQLEASSGAAQLRLLLSAGVIAALVLAAAAAWLQLTRGRSERVAQEAQEQTRDILKTVKRRLLPARRQLQDRLRVVRSAHAHVRPLGLLRPCLRGAAEEARAAGDPRHGDQIHQAAVGRARQREPDEEHQPARPARDSRGNRDGPARSALPPVRLPPRHGAQGRQARAGLGERYHRQRAAREGTARVAGEREPAGRHAAGRDARGPGATHVVPRCHGDGPAARQRHPQGARALRRRVPQEARRPVPRAALDKGRGVGAQPHERGAPDACPRRHGHGDEAAGGALGQRLPAAAAETRRAAGAPAQRSRAWHAALLAA